MAAFTLFYFPFRNLLCRYGHFIISTVSGVNPASNSPRNTHEMKHLSSDVPFSISMVRTLHTFPPQPGQFPRGRQYQYVSWMPQTAPLACRVYVGQKRERTDRDISYQVPVDHPGTRYLHLAGPYSRHPAGRPILL